MKTETGDLSILDYVRPVWRFKWLVLILVIGAAGAAYAYYKHKPTTYAASTELYVGSSTFGNLLSGGSGLVSTAALTEDAQLVRTPQVAARVVQDLRLKTTPNALLGSISVAADSTSDALELTVVSAQPQTATTLVNGFARAYLEVSTEAEQANAQAAINGVRRQLKTATGTERQALTNSLAQLEAAAALPAQVGQQISPALAAAPVAADPKRDAIFAGALALLLALIACYAFDRSDTRLRRLGDVERLLGLPVLASIPPVRRINRSLGQRTATAPMLREPYRALRVNLDVARLNEGVRTLLVTSGLPAEGKSTVVRNLALAYWEAGAAVAVIEGDMRRPVLTELFGVSSDRGLADVLQGSHDVRSVLVNVAGDGTHSRRRIDLLAAGRIPENPTALLSADAFRAVRNRMLATHDLVLVDSPPLLAVTDALAMATQVDGVLVVVRAKVTTEASITRLLQTLGQADVKLLGTVANAIADPTGVAAYGYYSHVKDAATAAAAQDGDVLRLRHEQPEAPSAATWRPAR